MPEPLRGEVWMVDLGMAAKVRPCVVISIRVGDTERALATAIAHTTSPRGTRFSREGSSTTHGVRETSAPWEWPNSLLT